MLIYEAFDLIQASRDFWEYSGKKKSLTMSWYTTAYF